jgi:hypothetical protein
MYALPLPGSYKGKEKSDSHRRDGGYAFFELKPEELRFLFEGGQVLKSN